MTGRGKIAQDWIHFVSHGRFTLVLTLLFRKLVEEAGLSHAHVPDDDVLEDVRVGVGRRRHREERRGPRPRGGVANKKSDANDKSNGEQTKVAVSVRVSLSVCLSQTVRA